MNADEYQARAQSTALYGNGAREVANDGDLSEDMLRLSYVALKLNGEAGELAEHVGKAIRDNKGVIPEGRRNEMLLELGDVMWYCAAIAAELRANLSEVMEMNLDKLESRQERGKLHGSGSDR